MNGDAVQHQVCMLCNDYPEVPQDITLKSQTDTRRLKDSASVCSANYQPKISNNQQQLTYQNTNKRTHAHRQTSVTELCMFNMASREKNAIYYLTMCSNQHSLITNYFTPRPQCDELNSFTRVFDLN